MMAKNCKPKALPAKLSPMDKTKSNTPKVGYGKSDGVRSTTTNRKY